MNHNVVDATFNDNNLESCYPRCVSCTNLQMELFKVTTELKLMTEIVRMNCNGRDGNNAQDESCGFSGGHKSFKYMVYNINQNSITGLRSQNIIY